MATCNWVMLGGFVALLGLPGSASAQTADADRATSLDRLRAAQAAGKVKEIDLDRGQVRIADAPPLSAVVERPALMTAAVVTAPGGAAVAPPAPPSRRLNAEVNQRLRDLESCRGGARTGQIQLRWRILPDGRTTNALVLEQQPTDMDVMKCARRRIEAWRFLTATAAPVDVELAYDFARTDTAATTAAAAARTPARAAAHAVATSAITSDKRTRTTSDESEGKVRARATGTDEAKVGEAKGGEAKLNEAHLEEGK